MSDKKPHTTTIWMGVIVVVLMALYVLSIGPAAWFAASGGPDAAMRPAILLPYFPLILVASASEPTLELLNWYIHLWAENISVGM